MMTTIIAIALFALAMTPLFLAGKGVLKNKKLALIINICAVLAVCICMLTFGVISTAADEAEQAVATVDAGNVSNGYGIGLIAAALTTCFSCIGAGIAVSSAASAAIGALSENPEVFGKALIFVALAEGVALYGLLISIQILSKL